MENSGNRQEDSSSREKAFELLSLVESAQDITVRDDQYDFFVLMDAVKYFKGGNLRFRLIDSGLFDAPQLERLCEWGIDLYTSDEARPNPLELEMINRAAKKGRACLAFFQHGKFEEDSEEETLSVQDLMNVGGYGVYIHISNRDDARDAELLNRLAFSCRRGGSWLVFYHHGPCDPSLVELGGNGAWIHLSTKSLTEEKNTMFLKDVAKSARSAGSNLVLFVEKDADFSVIYDAFMSGAILQFVSPLIDYKSRLKTLEKKIIGRKLDFRAYYLYPHFLL